MDRNERNIGKPLDMKFYTKPTLQLAKSLLGCVLIHESTEGTAAGLIVETEAYIGPADQASHSFQNRRTKRTEVMFGPSGHAYTYQMHTHCLFNIVSGGMNQPEAVLIRAVEPYLNKELIANRRSKVKNEREWTNGPGKLTKALGITMDYYGHPVNQSPLWLAKEESVAPFMIASGPRIGIDNAGEAKAYPWRYWILGNKFVSR
ncbi:DNA-3-methyladenine glycosylase [Aquibacillus sp. 3ASR75-11]|uniref:Putative 3-methyladenine DNA glycosylase n=1 Tax=Terrihalobacillus insolitus TaxID=2950438 RepID=A0A9X3WXC4_9BACI|nr:DNA-3-methyladenine glycosylase [Terrihalobacillus insolitus]MDC3426258.1 DNA-3-methyladenine glycosylase [Terrihalobacillus insolitus]